MATDSVSSGSPDPTDNTPLSSIKQEIKEEKSDGTNAEERVEEQTSRDVDNNNEHDGDDDDDDDDEDDDDDDNDGDRGMSKSEHRDRTNNGGNDDYSRNSSEDFNVETSDFPVRSTDDFKPALDDDGQPILEIECGENKAYLYLAKLCQGSKGQCILFKNSWLTPNEFQFVSGRETAKDWKRSIRHRGKCLKTLMNRGLLQTHPPICDCAACRVSTPVNRGRLADKRGTSAPTMVPTKRPSQSDYSGITITREITGPPGLLERNRKGSFDSSNGGLSAIISHLHQASGSQLDHNGRSSPDDTEAKKRPSVDRESAGLAAKRRRSSSPQTDDERDIHIDGEDNCYEEQQRRIYELANSLEPQHLAEHAKRTFQGNPISPTNSDSLSPANFQQSNLLGKQLHKSRKQSMPQHHDPETQGRGPTITLTYGSSKSTFPINRQNTYNGSRYTELTSQHNSHDRSNVNRNGMYIELKSRHDLPFHQTNSHGNSCHSNQPRSTSDTVIVNASSAPLENISNWTVEDVYQFVASLNGCAEYAQIFKDQAIDGETLPLLTEDHLLQNFGLKLGPALKIRLHVARRQGYCMYCRGSKYYDELNQQ